jgi:hypothetical protein
MIAMALFVCMMPTALAYGVVNSVNGGDMTAVQHISVSDNTHSMHDYLNSLPGGNANVPSMHSFFHHSNRVIHVRH